MAATLHNYGMAPLGICLSGMLAFGWIVGVPPRLLSAEPDRQIAAQLPTPRKAPQPAPRPSAGQGPRASETIPRAAQDLTEPIDDETVRRILAELELLVLPQQKERARALVRQYPNTRLAEIAQQLVNRYELYDEARALKQRLAKAHSLRIRAYWDARRPPHRPFIPPQIRITNRADEAVLYQVKTYETEWLGPYRLQPGDTDTFNSFLRYRRLTEYGTTLHTLRPGADYIFVKLAPEAVPQLFKSHGPH